MFFSELFAVEDGGWGRVGTSAGGNVDEWNWRHSPALRKSDDDDDDDADADDDSDKFSIIWFPLFWWILSLSHTHRIIG